MLFMKKKAVSAIMFTLLLTSMLTLAFNIQPFKAEASFPTLLETIYVDTTNPNLVWSNTVLEEGHQYLIEVSGTYFFDGAALDHVADSEYSSYDNWATITKDYVYPSTREVFPHVLDLLINEKNVDWGEYTFSHTYSINFLGIGSPISFVISDWWGPGPYPNPGYANNGAIHDNDGILTVRIYYDVRYYDDFSTDSGMWRFVQNVVNIDTGEKYPGSAYRDSANGYMVLTENRNYQAGVIWLTHDIFSRFTVEFRYKAGGGNGADGLVFMFYKQENYDPYDGGGLGFVSPPGGAYSPTAVPGYGIEFDNWQNGAFNDPSPNHIALIRDHVNNHLTYVDDNRIEDNQWHDVRITVGVSSIEVYVDNEILFMWGGAIDRTYGGLGFAATTASHNNWHIIDDVTITVNPPKITGIDPSRPIGGSQLLGILGEGFVPTSKVTFTIDSAPPFDIGPDRTSFISANRIEVVAGLPVGQWKVQVANPDGASSDYDFSTRLESDEDCEKSLGLAMQYTKWPYRWKIKDALIMTEIAGGESRWNPNAANSEVGGTHPYMGCDSFGRWQIFVDQHMDLLPGLANTNDKSQIAKWLLGPANNLKAAYYVWEQALGYGWDPFIPWAAYTQPNVRDKQGNFLPNPNYYKNFEDRVTKIANRMLLIGCPVNVTVRDDFDRVISETWNQIPGASFEYSEVSDSKIFYLPLNLTYHVQINSTAYGNCTINQITPTESIYEIAFSQAAFNLTSKTLAEFDLLPYNANYTLKVDENGDGSIDYELAPEVWTTTTEYDVGITETVPSETIIGEGSNLAINITITNYGAHTETFNVTFCVNGTFVELLTVTLASENSTTITFAWDTTGFPVGNYTISACAGPVAYETDTGDNTFVYGTVQIIQISGGGGGRMPYMD